MNKKLSLIFICLLLTGFSFAGPRIVLKLDDLSVTNGKCAFIPAMDFLLKREIKAGLGIIANRIDSSGLVTLKPYMDAVNGKGEQLFEFWHHGLDHVRPEFLETGYEYQKTHFEVADKLIKNGLGFQMHSFGAPFNAGDSVTNRVIFENPEYKVFMFSSVKPVVPNGIFYIDNRVNIENGTGNPDFNLFINNYNKYKNIYTEYMVLQGHPNAWTNEKLEQFSKIIDFLLSQNCEFVLPTELYNWHAALKSSDAD